jgi:hypothetical protein
LWAKDASLRINPCEQQPQPLFGDCSILRIQKKEILRVFHDEHKFSDLFIAYLVDRHSRTQADLVDQLFNSSEKGWRGHS